MKNLVLFVALLPGLASAEGSALLQLLETAGEPAVAARRMDCALLIGHAGSEYDARRAERLSRTRTSLPELRRILERLHSAFDARERAAMRDALAAMRSEPERLRRRIEDIVAPKYEPVVARFRRGFCADGGRYEKREVLSSEGPRNTRAFADLTAAGTQRGAPADRINTLNDQPGWCRKGEVDDVLTMAWGFSDDPVYGALRGSAVVAAACRGRYYARLDYEWILGSWYTRTLEEALKDPACLSIELSRDDARASPQDAESALLPEGAERERLFYQTRPLQSRAAAQRADLLAQDAADCLEFLR